MENNIIQLSKQNLVRDHVGVHVGMQHLVHWAVVQGKDVGRHLVDEDAEAELLLPRRGVQRVEDLLHVFGDVPRGVEHAAGHEGVGHPLLVDRGVPGLAESQGIVYLFLGDSIGSRRRFQFQFILLHLGHHQVAKVLGGGVDHPDARLVCGQVQVGVRVAFFQVAEVTLRVIPGKTNDSTCRNKTFTNNDLKDNVKQRTWCLWVVEGWKQFCR